MSIIFLPVKGSGTLRTPQSTVAKSVFVHSHSHLMILIHKWSSVREVISFFSCSIFISFYFSLIHQSHSPRILNNTILRRIQSRQLCKHYRSYLAILTSWFRWSEMCLCLDIYSRFSSILYKLSLDQHYHHSFFIPQYTYLFLFLHVKKTGQELKTIEKIRKNTPDCFSGK